MTLAGLLLAAGGATRFGSPKVLATYRGESLVGRAARLLAGRCPGGVHVVVGAAAEGVRAALAGEKVTMVENADWALWTVHLHRPRRGGPAARGRRRPHPPLRPACRDC